MNVGISMLAVDLTQASVSSSTYTFEHNIEKAITAATHITVSGLVQSSKTYNAMPAWYNVTDKKLFIGTGTHYFTVDGKTLTYT